MPAPRKAIAVALLLFPVVVVQWLSRWGVGWGSRHCGKSPPVGSGDGRPNAPDVINGDFSPIDDLIDGQGTDGSLSFREALKAANATFGEDAVDFAMPANIALSSALDDIRDSVVNAIPLKLM